MIGKEGKGRAGCNGTGTLLGKGNISHLDCGVGFRILCVCVCVHYIKGHQVLCLKLGHFILYLIFDHVCGVEERRKEKGRIAGAGEHFAVNLCPQLAGLAIC